MHSVPLKRRVPGLCSFLLSLVNIQEHLDGCNTERFKHGIDFFPTDSDHWFWRDEIE